MTPQITPVPSPPLPTPQIQPQPTPQLPAPVVAQPRQIAIFDDDSPDSPTALAAVQFARDAHIDVVINYSAIDGTPAQLDAYLNAAHSLGVKVIISLKDLLGPIDLSPDAADLHVRAYGRDTTTQVSAIVRRFDANPAVAGYLISDELPEEAGAGALNANIWNSRVKARYTQIRTLSQKRIMAVYYWNSDDRASFLRNLQSPGQDLMVDYYPLPDDPGLVPDQTYGTTAQIPVISGVVSGLAGKNGWFGLQGFSWSQEPETAIPLGFGLDPPAPTATQMTTMANLALTGGSYNLAIFSYGYAQNTPGQLNQIKAAVAQIRGLPAFH